jgi:aminoglycoside phosphotransferase (APT) family kinase protein
LTHFSRFPRGSSRDTWFVSYRDHTDATAIQDLVFRMDWPTGSIEPSPLYHEYFVYERLGRTALPIARAIHWEADPEWTGDAGPFYIRIRIAGDWEVPGFLDPDPKYDALRVAVSKDHLEKLAMVHRVDWKKLGFDEIFPPPPNCETAATFYIDQILQWLDDMQKGGYREGRPIILEAAEYLRKAAPPAPCICLCKGTNGLGEEVMRDGKVVALSDWEEAHLGDPAADFAFMQNFVPEINRDGRNLWGLDKAVEYYRQVSGIAVTADSVRYYSKVRQLKGLTYGINAAVSVSRASAATVRMAWVATEVLNISKRSLAGTAGIGPGISDEHWLDYLQTL